MKFAEYITIFLAAAAFAACNPAQPDIELNVSASEIACGPEGGVQKVRIGADENWVASTASSWITVSPANGRGSVECEIQIDSSLTADLREGFVRIEETALGGESTTLKITQTGFKYTISLEEAEVGIPSFESLENRKFDVKVNTNVDFTVVMKDAEGKELGWLKADKAAADFDKGIRPRNVNVRFNWDISSVPAERVATVEFQPEEGVILDRQDVLTVRQEAAEKIEIGARGDALALTGAARSLGMMVDWDISVPMSKWAGVVLWTEDDEEMLREIHEQNVLNNTDENGNPIEFNIDNYIGRVRFAQFYMFKTREIIPFEVQYLSAAEELRFVGNSNSFLYDLTPGEHIASLTQLRRLTLMGYGLTDIEDGFKALKNLESLDLAGNNFQKVPAVLTPENFPKLHSLVMSANQRKLVTDLSNAATTTKLGGFYDENPGGDKPDMIGCGIPERLLLWENLDTLKLAVNYLYGEIPDMEDVAGVKRYGDDPAFAGDSLTAEFISMNLPRILPNAKCLTINYNRLSGKLPDWLLYHPALDLWIPYTFIFSQEGTDPNGTRAMFSNEPVSLENYGERKSYYAIHPYKKEK